MCRQWRWVRCWEGPQSPDNIDFHTTWGVLVELSIAKAKGRTSQSAAWPSKNIHTYQCAQFSAWPLFSNTILLLKRASPFTLAFKWPFAPFLPTFGEQRRLGRGVTIHRRASQLWGRLVCARWWCRTVRRKATGEIDTLEWSEKAKEWRWLPTRPDASDISPMTISLLIVWLIMIK